MNIYPYNNRIITAMLTLILAVLLSSCPEDASGNGGGVRDSTPPLLSVDTISAGDTTLTIEADENISRAVADNAALLAGITVNRTPSGGTRGTDNLATAATLTDNTIVITISTPAVQGDEWFVEIGAGLVQDAAGNTNTEIELSIKIALTNQFLVADLPRSTTTFGSTTFVPDNYRSFFVTFSIGTGTATEGEYRLGLKAASKSAPTVSELTSATAALTRTLAAKKINVYLPFHIEGTYFNTGVTQDYATARATVLSPETSYTLYITPADGSGAVEKLLDFTTDAVASSVPNDSGGQPLWHGLPSAEYTYTVRENEPIMLIAEFDETTPHTSEFTHNDPHVINRDTISQCSGTTCTSNPAYPYQGWASNPAKTYMLAGLKDSWDSYEFNTNTTQMYVLVTFQTAP